MMENKEQVDMKIYKMLLSRHKNLKWSMYKLKKERVALRRDLRELQAIIHANSWGRKV